MLKKINRVIPSQKMRQRNRKKQASLVPSRRATLPSIFPREKRGKD